MSVNHIDVNAVNERTRKDLLEAEALDFELPEVPDTVAKAKPRIHRAPGDSACISCEG